MRGFASMRARPERRNAGISGQLLNRALAPHFQMLRDSHERLIKLTWWLIFLTFALIAMTGALIYVAEQTFKIGQDTYKVAQDTYKVAQDTFAEGKIATSIQTRLVLHEEFSNPLYVQMSRRIMNKQSLLTGNDPYTTIEIDAYLQLLNNIDLSYKYHYLTDDDLCVSFSQYVYRADDNDEIQIYIKSKQDRSNNTSEHSSFEGFLDLIDIMNNEEDQRCKDNQPRKLAATVTTSEAPAGLSASSIPSVAPPPPAGTGTGTGR
jgi:hypothetical protein